MNNFLANFFVYTENIKKKFQLKKLSIFKDYKDSLDK